jgi:hypothetical protein
LRRDEPRKDRDVDRREDHAEHVRSVAQPKAHRGDGREQRDSAEGCAPRACVPLRESDEKPRRTGEQRAFHRDQAVVADARVERVEEQIAQPLVVEPRASGVQQRPRVRGGHATELHDLPALREVTERVRVVPGEEPREGERSARRSLEDAREAALDWSGVHRGAR